MSTERNEQLTRCVFSTVIECEKQNIRKQIDFKKPLNIKQSTKYSN